MIETRVLSTFPGGVEYFHYNHATDEFTIERVYDNEPVLETNKALQNMEPGNWRGDMHRVAQIPLQLWQDLKTKGIIDDDERLRKWLNDPDNRFFRTKLGTV